MKDAHVEHMKWWGWGQSAVTFTHEDKPGLAPFIKKMIGVDVTKVATEPVPFEDLPLAAPIISEKLRLDLEGAVGAENVSHEPLDRVTHTYGKSLRDLVRIRRGELPRLPDVVVYPRTEDEAAAIVRTIIDNDAVAIPFGGGTNISGSLEPPSGEQRTIVSIDMGKMDRVLEIDEMSRTARVQAGVLGPALETQLNAKGWTIGHFPDSFNHSTLGGWIATRSSGMQSDKYGDIADLTRAVRVVTPVGVLSTRSVPSTSTGPSVREMILGSEGRLGVITEATVHVHRIPAERQIYGYLFPDWTRAIGAMQALAESDAMPSVTRVSDAHETQFSFATKKRGSVTDHFKSAALKSYLKRVRKYDLDAMCLSFIGYEGSADHVKRQKSLVSEIVKRFGGLCIGTSPGQIYDQKKFDTPYIRDFLLDRGALADVSETAAPWSQLVALHNGINERARKAFDEIGVKGYIMCHLSHSYHSGACLYFTFAFAASPKRDAIEQYDIVKHAIQQGFIDLGATLSHHHAVGTEHKQWLEQDISAAGVVMVQALVNGIDPGSNFNPGKIV